MNQPIPTPSPLATFLGKTGRVASLSELSNLVDDFESVLKVHGHKIKMGSQLERACLAVSEVLLKNQRPDFRTGDEDFRGLFCDVLGIWSLLKLTVRLQKHPTFPQFVPHLELLNKGTVVQNTRLRVSEEASNKIFELLFALVLLDVGTDILLDHPSLAKGDNPDILATIDGRRWGFALKTLYSQSPLTFFNNLQKGVQQIEDSEAEIGCVVVNFRNLIDHDLFLPIMNPEQYAAGAEPDFGVYDDPEVIRNIIAWHVKAKEDEIKKEIGDENVQRLFSGMKAIPGFAAFYQTRASKFTLAGSVPSDICSLGLANFADLQAYVPTFEKINWALHQRVGSP